MVYDKATAPPGYTKCELLSGLFQRQGGLGQLHQAFGPAREVELLAVFPLELDQVGEAERFHRGDIIGGAGTGQVKLFGRGLELRMTGEDLADLAQLSSGRQGFMGHVMHFFRKDRLKLTAQVERSLHALRTGNAGRPVFSETLFNWLQPYLPGARCLDLFAGSGVLGFEAASRGAAEVLLIDSSVRVNDQLQANRQQLGLNNLQIEQADALRWLEREASCWDIVFLDPPFADTLLTGVCRRLEEGGWLAPQARIYLEWDRYGPAPLIPEAWCSVREKQAGQVSYALYSR